MNPGFMAHNQGNASHKNQPCYFNPPTGQKMYEISTEILIRGLFILGGTIVGGVVGYFTSTLTNRNTARREAGNNLRAIFAPYLAFTRHDRSKTAVEIQDFIERGIDDVIVAMEKFRFFVRTKDLTAYDEACERYQSIAKIRAMNYESFGGKEPFKVFENSVHNILYFTDQT